MPVDPELRRLAAFTLDPAGGNPAGVWIGRKLPELAEMQLIAADVVGNACGCSSNADLVCGRLPAAIRDEDLVG